MIFIFILPLVVLIVSLVSRLVSGPFWLYTDPSYINLFNSFRIIQGQPPYDITHPGTPLQVLIAAIVRILNGWHNPLDAITQALINPEYYLHAVHYFILLSTFLTSVLLGAYVWRKTEDRLCCLLAQLVSLTYLILPSFNSGKFPVLPVVANVSDEPMLIIFMNLFNIFLLMLYFSPKHRQWKPVILLAIACALGLAEKMDFIFVFLAAFLLVPLRSKLTFLIVSALSFVFFTLPIISKYPQLLGWLTDITGHASRYGTGSAGFIDWNTFFAYGKMIFQQYWFFVVSASGLLALSLIDLRSDRQQKAARFIGVLTFCCLLHITATAKHFSFHYLLPAFGLFGTILPLTYLNLRSRFKWTTPLTAVFILTFAGSCIFYAIPYYQQLQTFSQDIQSFNEKISKEYPSCSIIPTTTVDMNFYLSQQEALLRVTGTTFRKDLESDILTRLYPHSYYFFSEEITAPDPYVESYGTWDFKQRILGDDLLTVCPCAIFIKSKSDFSVYPYQSRLLEQSKFLDAYLVTSSTEKEANELYAQSIDALNKGNLQEAFALGLKSRALNYEPRGQLEYMLNLIYSHLRS